MAFTGKVNFLCTVYLYMGFTNFFTLPPLQPSYWDENKENGEVKQFVLLLFFTFLHSLGFKNKTASIIVWLLHMRVFYAKSILSFTLQLMHCNKESCFKLFSCASVLNNIAGYITEWVQRRKQVKCEAKQLQHPNSTYKKININIANNFHEL